MMNKLMAIFFVILVFFQFYGEKTEAADFYSHIPFLYRVPEGSVGVFKNKNQFYEDVYPAGLYPVWPSDEGFNISITPQKVAVTKVLCITVEGVKITFPAITVHYQVHEDGVFDLVKVHGIDFVKPLIKNPVRQEVATLCATMTAETVYIEKFALLKQYLRDYLAKEQGEKGSGLSIGELEISSPPVLDNVIENYTGQKQSAQSCDQPYEIFYTLEDEQAARSRLCGSDGHNDETDRDPVPDDGMTRVVDTGSATSDQLAHEPGMARVAAPGNDLQPAYTVPAEGLSDQQAIDPFIDAQDAYGTEAEPVETGTALGQADLQEIREHTESGHNPALDTGSQNHLPGLERELSSQTQLHQDTGKENLHRHMQDSGGLWKNNNNRLYLVW